MVAGEVKQLTAERDALEHHLDDLKNQLADSRETNAALSADVTSLRQQATVLASQLDKVCFVV